MKAQLGILFLTLVGNATALCAVEQGTPAELSESAHLGPDRVRLTGNSPFKACQTLHRTKYLRDLAPDRLLAPFYYSRFHDLAENCWKSRRNSPRWRV
jgi:hypothetical protein